MLMRCGNSNSWQRGRDKELGRRWTLGMCQENSKVNSVCKYIVGRGRKYLFWDLFGMQWARSQKTGWLEMVREVRFERLESSSFFHPCTQVLPISCCGSLSLQEFVAAKMSSRRFFRAETALGCHKGWAWTRAPERWPEPSQGDRGFLWVSGGDLCWALGRNIFLLTSFLSWFASFKVCYIYS